MFITWKLGWAQLEHVFAPITAQNSFKQSKARVYLDPMAECSFLVNFYGMMLYNVYAFDYRTLMIDLWVPYIIKRLQKGHSCKRNVLGVMPILVYQNI